MARKFPDLANTQYPEALDTRTGDFTVNTNNVNHVMANDINTLQEAIIAIQRILGISPEGTFADVRARLADHLHDARYGGSGWVTTETLVGHQHTGGAGRPSRIDLAGNVTGLLQRTNIQLTHDATGALTGANIPTTSATSTSIDASINTRVNRAGDTMSGNLTAPVFISSVIQGTSPFQCTSTTRVNNLNSEMVNGHRITVAPAGTPPASPRVNDIWIDI